MSKEFEWNGFKQGDKASASLVGWTCEGKITFGGMTPGMSPEVWFVTDGYPLGAKASHYAHIETYGYKYITAISHLPGLLFSPIHEYGENIHVGDMYWSSICGCYFYVLHKDSKFVYVEISMNGKPCPQEGVKIFTLEHFCKNLK